MDFYKEYGLTPIINACGKMTHLSNARALPEVVDAAAASLAHFFDADEVQRVASRYIASFTGAEGGCVAACTAAGITLAVAAAMTGKDPAKIAQLPQTDGLKNEVVLQKGHAVNFGAPITQMIRLAGARPIEVGTVNGTTKQLLESAIGPSTAAVVFVVSHHTTRFGCVSLAETVEIAHSKGVPVIVDGAAQSFLIKEIVAAGADVVICSGHKYLSGTVSGLVCGRRDLMEAMVMQGRGIGRPMKVGKEGIFGLLAAIGVRRQLDPAEFYREIRTRVEAVCAALEGQAGVRTGVVDDPNGNPFCRARVWVDPDEAELDAATVSAAAADQTPSVRLRAHHVDEGYFDVDVIELTADERQAVVDVLRRIFSATPAEKASWRGKPPVDPRYSWLGTGLSHENRGGMTKGERGQA